MAGWCKRGILACLLGVGCLGCSTGPGRGLNPFPQGYKLTSTARDLRAAHPEPLPLPKELDKHPLPACTVEPGDVLLVQPVDLDSPLRLPGDQPILPDGTITLGRYGRVVVAGLTVEQIEPLVHEAVAARTPEAGPITVRVISRVSKVYYVLGAVNAPGAFTLNGRETVLDGLLAAGGLSDRASAGNIVLVRPTRPESCRVVLPICYREIVHVGDTSTNYQLMPGDRLVVPTRSFCEELFHIERECAPCGRPQQACPGGQ